MYRYYNVLQGEKFGFYNIRTCDVSSTFNYCCISHGIKFCDFTEPVVPCSIYMHT